MLPSLALDVVVFAVAALVIAVAGVRLTAIAESLAAATGLGQAVLGGVLIGAITSLAGTVTSVTAAADAHPDLAVGNAVGGIAAQTCFLVVADFFHRGANLEHSAAAEVNLTQGAVLIFLLSIALLGIASPEFSVFGIHPVTPVLFGVYLVCVRLISRSHLQPMWTPKRTDRTTTEPPAAESKRRVGIGEWLRFLVLVGIVAVMGWIVARSGARIAAETGLSDSIVGTLFTALSTSLPELVVAVSAVRRGALNLAVGDILGGNTFDVLFLGLSDIAYRPGSIYHAISASQTLWLVLCISMTAVLLLGLLRRQQRGFAGIGFESLTVIVLYAGGVALMLVSGA